MLSICFDNHKPIYELGLLNFMERLISDNREENFSIYLREIKENKVKEKNKKLNEENENQKEKNLNVENLNEKRKSII